MRTGSILARKALASFSLIVVGVSAVAQSGSWEWPADSVLAMEQLALFQDAVKAKEYKSATKPLHWLLVHMPSPHESTFIMAAEVYGAMADREKKVDMRRIYVDSLLLIYDMRMQYCEDKPNILNRKALASFKYNINGSNPEQVLLLMDEAFNLAGTSILDATLVPYMETIVVVHLKLKTLSEEQILNRYDLLLSITDEKLKSAVNDKTRNSKLKEHKTKIQDLLLKAVKVDCNFIRTNLAQQLKTSPEDLVLAKRIFGYMLQDKCERDSLWVATGEFIYCKENDFGLAKNLAVQFLLTDKNEKAAYYLNESLRLAISASDSADVFVYTGSLLAKTDNREGGRAAFRKALTCDPDNKEALNRIGGLYYNSFNFCARKVSMADDRLVYLIAYDYYQKAGNLEKMELCRRSFPSKEEIFLMNYSRGQTIHVDCWIDETTTIRTRD